MAKLNKISRRDFLTSALTASSGLALTGLVPLDSPQVNVHKELQQTNGNPLIIDIDDYEELKEIGGFKVMKEVAIGEITDSIIIVKTSETEFSVHSSICRHKKCNVKYKKDRDVFVCPCHGSTYDMNGKVIKGPSKDDIPKYKVTRNDNKLKVSI